MAEIEVFLMKPKHQNNLSQWGECVYGAQSWNEGILLCESMSILIERRTSILKMVEKEVFLMKQKHQYPNEENVFMVPNHENERDYYVNPCLPKSIKEH